MSVEVKTTGPSIVLPFLLLGSQKDVLSENTMKTHGITHVINVSVSGEKAPFLKDEDAEYFLRIPIEDSQTARLSSYLDEAYDFIEKARLNGGRVFVHCLAGISRSAALAIAYIMRHLHMSVDDAYSFVKASRSQISPNFNFLGQLKQYESKLSIHEKEKSTVESLDEASQNEITFRVRRTFHTVANVCTKPSTVGSEGRMFRRPNFLELSVTVPSASKHTVPISRVFTNLTLGNASKPFGLSKSAGTNNNQCRCSSATAVPLKSENLLKESKCRSSPKGADTLTNKESDENLATFLSESKLSTGQIPTIEQKCDTARKAARLLIS